MRNIQNAFNYTPADELESLPTFGIYHYYNGGGYVYKMMSTINQSYEDIQKLFESQWIDRNTRSLFVEFTLYNPNINLFAFCSILFEFLPTGNIIASSTFDNFDLYNVNSYEKLLTKIAFLIVVILFMLAEIKKILKLKKEYFKNPLNLFEWVLYSFSMTSLAMFAYKINTASQILNSIKMYSTNAYIRLQHIKYWNDILNMCFAFCSFIGFIKMTKLLDKSRTIFILIAAIKKSIKKVSTFIAILIFLYISFGQIFYIILYDQLNSFSTYIKTLEVLFQMTLGKFDSGSILIASPILGLLLMFFFNIIVVLVLLNLFFSIIGESLFETKNTIQAKSLDLYSSIKKKIYLKSLKERKKLNINLKYKFEPSLEENISELLNNFDRMNYLFPEKK